MEIPCQELFFTKRNRVLLNGRNVTFTRMPPTRRGQSEDWRLPHLAAVSLTKRVRAHAVHASKGAVKACLRRISHQGCDLLHAPAWHQQKHLRRFGNPECGQILMKRQPYLRLEESPEILLRDVEPQTHFSDRQVLPGTKMLDIIQHLTDSFVLDRVRSAPYFRKCREKHRNTAIWNSLSVNIVELNT